MNTTINAKQLRASLPEIVRRVRKGARFTDCSSFVMMQELKLREALTTDSHFRQMGFRTLPDLA